MKNWGDQPSEGGKAGHQGGGNVPNHTGPKGMAGPNYDPQWQQKRSMDPASVMKREKLAEQRPQGTLGTMWQNLMSGPGGPTPTGK
ncbi:Uu.00g062850.m01.CDS01 [Anthostomella pinea]|uniref:Uu.00g062850.m01.CDS01 n=1 Tax=Anthostomella pinea TaxID=933095 RepID=A0AAI8VTV9_9PEZI|nr:Uu.00g062850.m01.CDS01 [Anthostomella pinea]